MKTKNLRRFIRETLDKHPKGINYEGLLSKIWQKDQNTPIKKIENTIKKMKKWEEIKVVVPNRETKEVIICRVQKNPS